MVSEGWGHICSRIGRLCVRFSTPVRARCPSFVHPADETPPTFAANNPVRAGMAIASLLRQSTPMATLLSDSTGHGRTPHIRTNECESTGPGELLRRARERLGLTLDQISNETKIPRRHLEALERDHVTAVPGGFYRRAEIRAYARAVHVDQNLALAQLERASKPPVAHQRVFERPRIQTPLFSHKHVKRALIVIGVVVTAAVLGRAMGGRESALDRDAQLRSATDSPPRRAQPVRETPSDAVVGTSQRTPLDQVAPPSAPSEGALAPAMETAGTRALVASDADVAVTKDDRARASADSVTELVVTTQPSGTRVTVNGIGWGTAPVTIRHLPPGDKRIRVSKEGYATEERLVRLGEGDRRMLDVQLRNAP
jgi:cytoskeletal protein RodZ